MPPQVRTISCPFLCNFCPKFRDFKPIYFSGSGKTTVAEIALLRMKKIEPKAKCVYIAPLKSLARERLKEWRRKLGSPPLNWKVLELSGDTHHDEKTLKKDRGRTMIPAYLFFLPPL